MKISKLSVAVAVLMIVQSASVFGQQLQKDKGIVPGTGKLIEEVGDDFEDEKWVFNANFPKVLNNKETALSKNYPIGISANKRWFEGQKRGQPDSVRRVSTPPNGIPGSQGALAIRSLRTGGNHPTHVQQQDDFIADISGRIGEIDVTRAPNVVTRVWLPPIDEWENRTGCHFAYRVGLETNYQPRHRSWDSNDFDGAYWPGMFIHLDSKEGKGASGLDYDSAHIWMKATDDGRKMIGPYITRTGWWTLGMSVTPDGRVHYYAKAGVEDLTEDDHIGSSYPFGHRAKRFRSMFFNVCNGDDGKTWSTEFVIDDPRLYLGR